MCSETRHSRSRSAVRLSTNPPITRYTLLQGRRNVSSRVGLGFPYPNFEAVLFVFQGAIVLRLVQSPIHSRAEMCGKWLKAGLVGDLVANSSNNVSERCVCPVVAHVAGVNGAGYSHLGLWAIARELPDLAPAQSHGRSLNASVALPRHLPSLYASIVRIGTSG